MVKNGYYWSKMVQYRSKKTQNMKSAKIVQTILGKKCDIRIYSNIFDKYIFICKKRLSIFSRANLFGYLFVIFLSCQIYLDIHSSNIYGYSLVKKELYSSHTDSQPLSKWLRPKCYKTLKRIKIKKCCTLRSRVHPISMLFRTFSPQLGDIDTF